MRKAPKRPEFVIEKNQMNQILLDFPIVAAIWGNMPAKK